MSLLLFLGLLSAAGQAPSKETLEIPGTKLKVELVGFPAGKAKVSDPAKGEALREIELRSFSIAARDVTWAEFQAFRMAKEPKGADAVTRPTQGDSFFGQVGISADFTSPKAPLTNIRWHSAAAYCEWLSRVTGRYFRLPTEAEWEMAARAGQGGDGPEALDSVAWYKDNSNERTHPPGGKSPNAFGLYDMMGNVWQYCLEPHTLPDFSPVLRGGCWGSTASELRFAKRQTVPWGWCDSDTNTPQSVWWMSSTIASQGFRVVSVADASDRMEREEYAAKIETRVAKGEEWKVPFGMKVNFFCRVTGEIKNAGDRVLDEVEVKVYYLDPKGNPHLAEITGANKPGQATFGKGWPVMANSYHPGAQSRPLKPGETRPFSIDMPSTFDAEWEVDKTKFGARVTALRFGKKDK